MVGVALCAGLDRRSAKTRFTRESAPSAHRLDRGTNPSIYDWLRADTAMPYRCAMSPSTAPCLSSTSTATLPLEYSMPWVKAAARGSDWLTTELRDLSTPTQVSGPGELTLVITCGWAGAHA